MAASAFATDPTGAIHVSAASRPADAADRTSGEGTSTTTTIPLGPQHYPQHVLDARLAHANQEAAHHVSEVVFAGTSALEEQRGMYFQQLAENEQKHMAFEVVAELRMQQSEHALEQMQNMTLNIRRAKCSNFPKRFPRLPGRKR